MQIEYRLDDSRKAISTAVKYDIYINGFLEGRLTYCPDWNKGNGYTQFHDFSSKVRFGYYNKTHEDMQLIVEQFYTRKQGTVGSIKVNNTNEFKTMLEPHLMGKYYVDGFAFFFYDEHDLTVARLLI